MCVLPVQAFVRSASVDRDSTTAITAETRTDTATRVEPATTLLHTDKVRDRAHKVHTATNLAREVITLVVASVLTPVVDRILLVLAIVVRV